MAKPCQAHVRGWDGSAGGRGGRGVGVGPRSRREARTGEPQGRAGQSRPGQDVGGVARAPGRWWWWWGGGGRWGGRMGPCLESGGKGRGQAVTVMGLWHEEDGGGALHLAGVAGERASHTGARCRRLLRLSGGLRTQASQRQKRGARRGPDLVRDGWARRTAPETKVTTHQEQMSSLGCDMAAGTWWDGEWWLAARVAEISRGPRRARM